MELLKNPWHWSVAGVLIGLMVPVILILGKRLGVSSSLRHFCAATIPAKIPFFNYNWKDHAWNLFFVVGIMLGGFIGATFLADPSGLVMSEATASNLAQLGLNDTGTYLPTEIFSWEQLFTLRGFLFIMLGGFLVGFGVRYAGGCTSGHSIMGLSNLQWPSLVATICFMLGGILVTHFVIPYIL